MAQLINRKKSLFLSSTKSQSFQEKTEPFLLKVSHFLPLKPECDLKICDGCGVCALWLIHFILAGFQRLFRAEKKLSEHVVQCELKHFQ